jgi:hypothetical protein
VPVIGMQVVDCQPLPAVATDGVQLLARSAFTSAVQAVLMKLPSTPSVQDATGVAGVLEVLQVTTGSTPGTLGVQEPAAMPSEVSATVQAVLVQLFEALAAWLVQADPGASCVGPVVLLLQLVTL